jgi:vitamin B12 transporter
MSILLAALLSLPAEAPLPGGDPDIVVVEGTRLGQTLREAGTAASVLTDEDFRRLGFTTLGEALAHAPGVTVNRNGPFGGAASVRIRGAGSDQTLVLIDGVPVGDPSAVGGAFDFARLDTAEIEKVEILKGPQSVLWGSEAIGGVVSITTKKAGESGGRAFLEGGSFATVRGGGSLLYAGSESSMRLGVNAAQTDGISKADRRFGNDEDDGFENLGLQAGGTTRLGALHLDGSLLYQKAEAEFDGFSFAAPGGVADADERSETEELTLSLSARAGDAESGLAQSLLLGHRLIDRDNFASGAPSFDAYGERSTLRYQLDRGFGEKASLAAGAELDHRSAEGASATIASLFGLASVKPVPALTISAGLRRDEHDGFGSADTARLAASFEVTPGLSFRASFGEGFKAPSLFQETFFCCGAGAANDDLRPERSEGFDAGVLYTADRLRFELGWFRLETEDLIDFDFFAGGYINIEEAHTEGVEASFAVQAASWLNIEAQYGFTEAEDGDGARLLRLPRHQGDFIVSFVPEGPFSASLLIRHNGEEEDSSGTLDAWTRADLTARYSFSEGLEAYGRIENIGNASYQEVLGYGTPGRALTAGLRRRF